MMIPTKYIIIGCWIIFCLYWFISAGSVKPTQETEGRLAGNWHSIWLIIGGLFLSNVPFLANLGVSTSSLTTLLIPHSIVVNVVAIVFVITGLIVAILARRTLAGNWSRAVAFKEDHELITTGLYHYVRHPIYSGILLMISATVLFVGTLSAAVGFVIIVLSIWFKLRAEEALLTKHFPKEYSAYKDRTKALIPYIV
jgi:protein-S-isoprenylcysteine O-methyltransferase Ste14